MNNSQSAMSSTAERVRSPKVVSGPWKDLVETCLFSGSSLAYCNLPVVEKIGREIRSPPGAFSGDVTVGICVWCLRAWLLSQR